MLRIIPIFLFSFFFLATYGQKDARLPADLRQHNLTTYNASLFNPAFSLDRNNPESLAFWVRWQGQDIDADPTTMFLNYTRKLNDKSAAGVAFFQHNTGVFFNTGGALNYAYQLEFNSIVKLTLGLNVFAFKQTLADDRFPTDPNVPLPLPTVANDFILQMAPGASLSIERLTLSIASENLFDYNFTAKETNSEKEDKIFMSLLSYDFPITLGSVPNAFLRPSMYLRTIPGQSNQVGFNTLLNTNKYWGQIGYNNFYGYAVGLGGTFFKHLSVGALVEFGTSASISTESSFELMAAYFFGKPEERHKVVGFYLEEDENALLQLEQAQDQKEIVEKELEKAEDVVVDEKAVEKFAKEDEKQQRKQERMVQDSIAKIAKETALAARVFQKQLEVEAKEQSKKAAALVEAQQKEQALKLDSINRTNQAEALKGEQKRKQDSLIAVALEVRRKATLEAKKKAEEYKIGVQNEADKPEADEKYEEVKTEAGLLPGYYLIANVFGTKKYFDAFMLAMKKKGLEPRAFIRSTNKYNYVYLNRYPTMKEARQARDSKLEGTYSGETWIFRVVGD